MFDELHLVKVRADQVPEGVIAFAIPMIITTKWPIGVPQNMQSETEVFVRDEDIPNRPTDRVIEVMNCGKVTPHVRHSFDFVSREWWCEGV